MVYGMTRWGRFTALVRTWISAMGMWSMGSTANGSSLQKQPANVGTTIISLTRKPGERVSSPESNSDVKYETKPMERNHHETNISKGQTCAGCDSSRVLLRDQRTSARSRFENDQRRRKL